jgi:hypothetical protein
MDIDTYKTGEHDGLIPHLLILQSWALQTCTFHGPIWWVQWQLPIKHKDGTKTMICIKKW